jgi:hypothetical protein
MIITQKGNNATEENVKIQLGHFDWLNLTQSKMIRNSKRLLLNGVKGFRMKNVPTKGLLTKEAPFRVVSSSLYSVNSKLIYIGMIGDDG